MDQPVRRLRMACGDYDRTRPLRDGRVAVQGVELEWTEVHPERLFFRQLASGEFDVSEMSLARHVIGLSRGETAHVALPAFPSRLFRHGFVWVRRDAGLTAPADLRGRRIGVLQYQVTAAVWMRGILADEHGLRPEDVTWVEGGLDEPGRAIFPDRVAPPGVRITPAPPGTTLSDLLLDGRIDAIVAPRCPSAVRGGEPRMVRLFPDTRAVTLAYWRRTRVFPIMHCMVVRRELYDACPALARRLYAALARARDLALQDLVDGWRRNGTLPVMLPLWPEAVEEALAEFGPDPWPYGVAANRPTLDAFHRYLREQGLLQRDVPVDRWFVPEAEAEG